MLKPWELPGADSPHHALPLGHGQWRAPAPTSSAVQSDLQSLGVDFLGLLPDGAGRYSIHPQFSPPTDCEQAHPSREKERPLWIAARLASAIRSWQKASPAPGFFGILNLSPDSFSDGGQLGTGVMGPLYHAQCLKVDGFNILDLGAESTRPGALPVSPQQQLQKLLPVLESLLPLQLEISIDTRSAEVAERCLDAGAHWINDVSGLQDPQMAPLLASANCHTVLMHMRGTPETMQQHCQYQHVLGEVADELMQIAQRALSAGLAPHQIVLDPGIGFAKTAEQSQHLLANIGSLRALGFPLLVGPSRKSFMADILPGKTPAQRDGGTAGAAAICAQQGVDFLRLHKGGKTIDACKVAAACTSQHPPFPALHPSPAQEAQAN